MGGAPTSPQVVLLVTVLAVKLLHHSDAAGLDAPELQAALGDKVGCGWKIVRRVKSGGNWHPATDHCTGTASYGTPDVSFPETADNTWSTTWSSATYSYFLFATGDFSRWMITEKDQVFGNYANQHRTILRSSQQDSVHTARWYNRNGNSEDPWISLSDHGPSISAGTLMYGANSYGGTHASSLSANGMNVYISDSQMTSCVTSTTTITTTTTTGTSTTTTHHQHILDLTEQMKVLENTVENLRGTVKTLKEDLKAEKGAAAAATSALLDLQQMKTDRDSIDRVEMRELRSLVDALMAPAIPAEFINPVSVDDDTQLAVKCGWSPKAPSCTPSIEVVGPKHQAATLALHLNSIGGQVTFETAKCPETDLCEMSRKLDAIDAKFNPEVPP